MSNILAERRQRLADIAKSNGLGAIAFVPGANFSDLSGLHFHLMECPILLFVTADNQIVASFRNWNMRNGLKPFGTP